MHSIFIQNICFVFVGKYRQRNAAMLERAGIRIRINISIFCSCDGIHMGKEAYVAILEYIRTHAIDD